MAITRTQIVDTLDANLNEMFQDGTKGWPEEYSKIFNVLNSDKQSEKDSYESGFGLVPVKAEGANATYDTIYPGIAETYTHSTYAMGYEITEEAILTMAHDSVMNRCISVKFGEALIGNTEPSPIREGVETRRQTSQVDEGIVQTTNLN